MPRCTPAVQMWPTQWTPSAMVLGDVQAVAVYAVHDLPHVVVVIETVQDAREYAFCVDSAEHELASDVDAISFGKGVLFSSDRSCDLDRVAEVEYRNLSRGVRQVSVIGL